VRDEVNHPALAKQTIVVRVLTADGEHSQQPQALVAVRRGRRVEQGVEHGNVVQVKRRTRQKKFVHQRVPVGRECAFVSEESQHLYQRKQAQEEKKRKRE
jgi:hypothetical protein